MNGGSGPYPHKPKNELPPPIIWESQRRCYASRHPIIDSNQRGSPRKTKILGTNLQRESLIHIHVATLEFNLRGSAKLLLYLLFVQPTFDPSHLLIARIVVAFFVARSARWNYINIQLEMISCCVPSDIIRIKAQFFERAEELIIAVQARWHTNVKTRQKIC
jgi:hypothetical protein